MTSSEIRNSFLSFFEQRGHTIVPSSSVVPFEDPTLLFTNAGMNQFKDVFLGTGKRPYARAADTQKCIRVSGKHNDLEEVGVDGHHHTFFEMLGNWSFGDYYKKEAIEWAWELLTMVWGLPKQRLWATIYCHDDEAGGLWRSVTDIDPSHILRFDEKDNFWEMGETGPCGPCSEIHYDRTPQGDAPQQLVNSGSPNMIEIWNLVFIQYDKDSAGTLHLLPSKHVDTGMGFERMCAILQGKHSNYDTDVFTPIISHISKLTKKTYTGRLESTNDIAMRVLADHVRTLTFAIADGAVPSNEGRGYVLRRILRRASRFARKLDVHDPIIYKLLPSIVDSMGHMFPEIREKRIQIEKIIKGEEEAFNATLDRGLEIFDDVVKKAKSNRLTMISGEDAFKLYDTYGFPLDLTQLIAREQDLTVDEELFSQLLEQQRKRSRGAGKFIETASTPSFVIADRSIEATSFSGYDTMEEAGSRVLAISGEYVILDRTPFYAESGGQVGDTGTLKMQNTLLQVQDTQRDSDIIAHRVPEIRQDIIGQSVIASVDRERRLSIMRNHTATHLLHAALRQILGSHVQQAGSLVAPTHLRFDFSHFTKVTAEELSDLEDLVNEKIKENIALTHYRNIPFEEAKKMGALMFFGDKYGDRVNVVEFSEFSREFCGGTHLSTTKDIAYFKFRSEGSIASGVRRIEAVTSDYALELFHIQESNLSDRLDYAHVQLDECSRLRSQLASLSDGQSLLLSDSFSTKEHQFGDLSKDLQLPGTARDSLKNMFEHQAYRSKKLEDLILDLSESKRSLEKELTRYRLKGLSSILDDLVKRASTIDSVRIVSAEISVPSSDELKSAADTLRLKLGSGVGVLASIIDEKISFVCVVTDNLVAAKRIEAGKVVAAVAKIAGGEGGGKPHMATAGGKDLSKLNAALEATSSIVKSFLEKIG